MIIQPDPESLREDLPHILSLGAGVQSSCMALMAAQGEVTPMPKAAIFADTKAEPPSVYSWLDWLEKQLPFPVYRTQTGEGLTGANFEIKTSKKSGKRYWRNLIPFYTLAPDGGKGVLFRKCTTDYKITPLLREVKRIVGIQRAGQKLVAIQWIGISMDELTRMKESRMAFVRHRWPLIELGLTRQDCLAWMEKNGFPEPPRSACSYCPYHSNGEWRRMTKEDPEGFQAAVEFERKAQEYSKKCEVMDTVPFLHPSCVPLDEIDFDGDKNQFEFSFDDECEGMCGN